MKLYADVTTALLTEKFVTEELIWNAKDNVVKILNNYSPFAKQDGYERKFSLSHYADFTTETGQPIEFYYCPVVGSMKINGSIILLTANGDEITLRKDW